MVQFTRPFALVVRVALVSLYKRTSLVSRAFSRLFHFAIASILLEALITTIITEINRCRQRCDPTVPGVPRGLKAVANENPEYAIEAFLRRVAAQIGLEFQRVDQLTGDVLRAATHIHF